MDKKYGEFVGVKNLHYAIISQDDEAGYVANAPVYLAPAAEIAGEAEINNTPTYYDNKPGFNYVSEGVTTLTITVSGVPARLMAILLGKHFDEASGRVYDSGQPNPPNVAIGFEYGVGPRESRLYWYLAGTFSGGAEEAATKSNDVDIRTYQLTYTAVATTHEWDFGGELTALKRVFGDTADDAFDKAGWFAQVQTPDASGTPPALALSSIVPADLATSVAVDSTIVLTFSNRIASDAVNVLNADSGDIVTAARSWDTAGKVLTLTPNADLDNNTRYIITVSGVKDVYGQELAASTSEFTTAA
ncbi:major tail protein [Cohnella sp.]|uniref:major tail protein n=1 Tax=Cohnella sp. TaxID=1883426 RepID=UPI0035654A35